MSPGFVSQVIERTSATALENLSARPVPSLYKSGAKYQLDPRGCNHAATAKVALARGSLDCEDGAAWRWAELTEASGEPPVLVVTETSIPRTVHVRLKNEDPSKVLVSLGRYIPGRRDKDQYCPVAPRPLAEAGYTTTPWAVSQDPKHLDIRLRVALERGKKAGLPVELHSGWRPRERQVELWDRRCQLGRAKGERAPRNWAHFLREPARYGGWVHAERQGEHGRPPLLLPDESRHTTYPARAGDMRGPRWALDEWARLNASLVYRPIKGEPWHMEVRTDGKAT